MKKKKKKGYPYESANDGDIQYRTNHIEITCCDCGLRHFVTIDKVLKNNTIKTNNEWLAFRFYRDKAITQLNRKIRKWKK